MRFFGGLGQVAVGSPGVVGQMNGELNAIEFDAGSGSEVEEMPDDI